MFRDPQKSVISRSSSIVANHWLISGLVIVMMLNGCATYSDRVAPVPLPGIQARGVDVGGVQLLAEAYVNVARAKETFGFDIRGAGLLPVRFVVDNQTNQTVQVTPDQTFLIDDKAQAWPLLRSQQAYTRVQKHVEIGETTKATATPALLAGAAGAILGAAVGIVAGKSAGEAAARGAAAGAALGALSGGYKRHREIGQEIRSDLTKKSLRNRRIKAGELAYGFLFFPGKQEARSAQHLRLGIKIGERQHIVNLTLR